MTSFTVILPDDDGEPPTMEYVAPAHRYIVELPESPPTNASHMDKGIYGSVSSVVSIQTLFIDSDEPPIMEYIAPVD